MNLISKLEDLTRNPWNIPRHRGEIMHRRMEQLFGLRLTSRFHFATPRVEEIFRAAGENAPRLLKGDAEQIKVDRRLIAIQAARKFRTIILTGLEYEEDEVIMSVFGTLYESEDVVPKGIMIKTKMGLVISPDTYGGLWKYLVLSCKPNVTLDERFIKVDDGNGGFRYEYRCSITALKRVGRGEPFRISPNTLYKIDAVFDCDCDEPGCVGNLKGRFRCLEEGCSRYNKQYSDPKAYRDHMKKHEKADAVAAGEEVSDEEEGEPEVDCDEPTCQKKYTTRKNMRRHFRQKHVENPLKHICPHCNNDYTMSGSLTRHLEDSKKGCKAHIEAQKKLPTQELGLRTELSKKPDGRKCDGYKILKTDRKRNTDSEDEPEENSPDVEVEDVRRGRSSRRPMTAPSEPLKKPPTTRIPQSKTKAAQVQFSAPSKRPPKTRDRTLAEDCQPSTSSQSVGSQNRNRLRNIPSTSSVQPPSSRIPRAVPSNTGSLPATLAPPPRTRRGLRSGNASNSSVTARPTAPTTRRNQAITDHTEEDGESTESKEKKGKKKVTKKGDKEDKVKGNKKPEDDEGSDGGKRYGLRTRK